MNKRTKVSAMAAIGLGLGGFGLLGPNKSDSPPAEPTPSTAPLDVQAKQSVPPGLVEAVQEVFPVDVTVTRAIRTESGGADFDDFTLVSDGGHTYGLTLYRHFAADELKGLEPVSSHRGAWIGASDPDLNSIYAQGAGEIGLWVSSTPKAGAPVAHDKLAEMAAVLLSSDLLFEEVQR